MTGEQESARPLPDAVAPCDSNVTDPEVISLPGSRGLTTLVYLALCKKCGRRIVLELIQNGSPHHLFSHVTCGDCLALPAAFRRDHPAEAGRIDAFTRGE